MIISPFGHIIPDGGLGVVLASPGLTTVPWESSPRFVCVSFENSSDPNKNPGEN